MNILVIGGSGFIGTALIKELLTLGYYVRNFDKNPSVDFSELSTIADVHDKDALKEALKEVDVVFNLAAEHRDDVRPGLKLGSDLTIDFKCVASVLPVVLPQG